MDESVTGYQEISTTKVIYSFLSFNVLPYAHITLHTPAKSKVGGLGTVQVKSTIIPK